MIFVSDLDSRVLPPCSYEFQPRHTHEPLDDRGQLRQLQVGRVGLAFRRRGDLQAGRLLRHHREPAEVTPGLEKDLPRGGAVRLAAGARSRAGTVSPMVLTSWVAVTNAERFLSPLGPHWSHVRQVGEQARRIAHVVPPADRDLLVAAAYLHDVGYAPELAKSGFHPLDGARHRQRRRARLRCPCPGR